MNTRNSIEKRERIVLALYECLAVSGQEKVSIKDIARMAELPHGVIHYYFRSKDEIVTALGEYIVQSLFEEIDERFRNIERKKALPVLIDFMVDRLVFDPKLGRVFYNLIQMTFERESLRSVMAAMLGKYRESMTAFFYRIGKKMRAPTSD